MALPRLKRIRSRFQKAAQPARALGTGTGPLWPLGKLSVGILLVRILLVGMPLLSPLAQAQDSHLVTPGKPGSENHHLDWPDLDLEWGIGFDMRAPIRLSSFGEGERDGEVEAHLRAIDLVLRTDFNRDLWGFALVAADEETIALERAALVYGGLSGSSYLRVGRIPIDFGKQMQARPYDLPYPGRPAVLRQYLGDQVHMTGVAYGDIFATGARSTLRVSLGLQSGFDRDLDPAGVEPELPSTLSIREGPRLDELGLVGRMTGVVDVGDEGVFQWGLSAQGLPDYSLTGRAADGSDVRLAGQEQWIYGADLSFGYADESEGPAWSAGWEGLLVSGQSGGEILNGPTPAITTFDADLFGQYLWLERRTRSGRALGALLSTHQVPSPGKPDIREARLYFSRPLIENALLRFEIRHREVEGGPDGQALMVQFVALAGSLGHALDW